VITIDPQRITDPATNVNVNINIEITDPDDKIEGMPGNSILIQPEHHGEFGLEISFDISAEDLAGAGLNSDNVRLFHVDDNGVVTEEGRVVRNADGSVTIGITHASYWVLSDEIPEFVREILIRLGFVLDGETFGISDAVEILKWVVKLDSEIEEGTIAWDNARVTGGQEPSIADAVEILKWVVKLEGVLSDIWQ
jgi:hypothetical protein